MSRAPRPCGISSTSGHRAYRSALPTMAEIRALAARLGGSSRRGRCGRPGKQMTDAEFAQVLAELKAAAKTGRGLQNLSRDKLDALVARLSPKQK